MKKLILYLFSICLLSSCAIFTKSSKNSYVDATTLTPAQQDSLALVIMRKNWEKHVVKKNKEDLFKDVTIYVDTINIK